jgi:hypothetical protein
MIARTGWSALGHEKYGITCEIQIVYTNSNQLDTNIVLMMSYHWRSTAGMYIGLGTWLARRFGSLSRIRRSFVVSAWRSDILRSSSRTNLISASSFQVQPSMLETSVGLGFSWRYNGNSSIFALLFWESSFAVNAKQGKCGLMGSGFLSLKPRAQTCAARTLQNTSPTKVTHKLSLRSLVPRPATWWTWNLLVVMTILYKAVCHEHSPFVALSYYSLENTLHAFNSFHGVFVCFPIFNVVFV